MFKIQSPNRTKWDNKKEATKQPDSINYDKLMESLANKEELKSGNSVQDFRKVVKKQSDALYPSNSLHEDTSIQKIDKESIIPVPGLMIEHENSESDWQPSSQWQTPQGQQWSPSSY